MFEEVHVRFEKLSPHAIAPQVSQPGDVAADLFASEAIAIPARGRALIPTGLKLELPEGFRGSIRSRSGLSLKHGLEAGAGLIDQGYRHQLGVLLYNHGETEYLVQRGDRIAQLCIERYTHPCFVESAFVTGSDRSEGWGSSGK